MDVIFGIVVGMMITLIGVYIGTILREGGRNG